MPQAIDALRIHETIPDHRWPDRTQVVSYIGDACVVQGSSDFGVGDLSRVRGLFPGRYVTLDGDVITVWPSPRQEE
ncbi:putative protein OS=Streptomyces griseomycini OX=66895 GN=FHS37_007368 PE=4 SV=1 [Streptomyces griseomycini]|uniref:Uncharacterized protein n=1 Tax=Streptomyces griseomycini TaxID=66895 RepID=A0A7W7VAT9_9ACTN|nr:hypothetical protein [Streptomyces griseomycini]GGR43868.1 hypothetical protein GCM10015536_57310 [Streptomyces griseomycini]